MGRCRAPRGHSRSCGRARTNTGRIFCPPNIPWTYAYNFLFRPGGETRVGQFRARCDLRERLTPATRCTTSWVKDNSGLLSIFSMWLFQLYPSSAWLRKASVNRRRYRPGSARPSSASLRPPPPPLRLLIFGLLLCMLSLLNMRLFQCGCTWKGEVRARVTRFTPGCEAALSQLSRGRTKRGRLGLIVDQDLDYSFEISTEVSGTGLQGECARVQARERRHRNSGRARHVTRQSHSNRALTCSIRLRKPLKSSLYLVG